MLGVKKWSDHMKRFMQDDSGATAIEYGLIASAMALCLIAAMPSITNALKGRFITIGTNITTGK
jgi:pilus assembly protein Flp/PilA